MLYNQILENDWLSKKPRKLLIKRVKILHNKKKPYIELNFLILQLENLQVNIGYDDVSKQLLNEQYSVSFIFVTITKNVKKTCAI